MVTKNFKKDCELPQSLYYTENWRILIFIKELHSIVAEAPVRMLVCDGKAIFA